MAIVSVTIIEGRQAEVKQELMSRLTAAVVDVLEADPRHVRIYINEVQDGDYAVAGKPVSLRGSGHV